MKKKKRKNSRLVSDYIRKLPEFARPICEALRYIILKSHPGIKESWNWGPHYFKNGKVCGFGFFNDYVTMVFFNGVRMKDPHGMLQRGNSGRNSRFIRFSDIGDVNEDLLTAYLREAIALNEKKVDGGLKHNENASSQELA